MEEQGRAKEIAKQHSAIPDDQLFKVATKAKDVKKKREKLKEDRFKEKEYLTRSPYEEVLVKRLIEKSERKQSQPPAPPKKKEDNDDFADLWSSENTTTSRNLSKFKRFTE